MQYKSRISSGKVVILGHLGMPGHKHLKWQYQFKKKKPLLFIYRQKINFVLHIFLEILERYCKVVILDTLGHA